MNPIDIKYLLAKRGLSQTAIAVNLGVTTVAVHRVINRESASRRIAEHIAAALERPVEELWPGRYDQSDRRAA